MNPLLIAGVLGGLAFLLLVGIWWQTVNIAAQAERTNDLLTKLLDKK